MKKNSGKSRALAAVLFLLYIALALYVLFFSEGLDRNIKSSGYRYNLIPFSEIRRFWRMRYSYGYSITLVNLLGNVVCFVPFGYLLPKLFKYKKSIGIIAVTLLAFWTSLAVETVQLVLKVGAFDVDDLLLNTIGGLIGYILLLMVRKVKKAKTDK